MPEHGEHTKRYLAVVAALASRPAKSWDDVSWQIEHETGGQLDSREFYKRTKARCWELGIKT
jgi:hypothetical protein